MALNIFARLKLPNHSSQHHFCGLNSTEPQQKLDVATPVPKQTNMLGDLIEDSEDRSSERSESVDSMTSMAVPDRWLRKIRSTMFAWPRISSIALNLTGYRAASKATMAARSSRLAQALYRKSALRVVLM